MGEYWKTTMEGKAKGTMIPNQLKEVDFRFLLLKPKGKEPFEPQWQKENYKFDDPKLLKHISNKGNYGIIGGFGNLIIIDADSEEINKIVEENLQETFTVKTGAKEEHKKHYFYIIEKQIKPIRLGDKGSLGDVRSTGQYVVAPGSTHPSGNLYKVINDIPITKIKSNIILNVLKELIDKEYKIDKREYAPDTTKREDEYIKNCRTLDYFGINKTKQDTSKNWILFRYLTDIAYNRGVSKNYLFNVCEIQGHSLGAINGWIKNAQEGKLEKSNCKKMRDYLEKYHNEIIEDICIGCPLIINKEDDNRNKIRDLDDLLSKGIPKIEWVVDKLVRKGGVTILAGSPGSMKTFTAMQLSLCCVAGESFLNQFNVKRINVLYVDEENGDIVILNRFGALQKSYNFKKEDLKNLKVSIFNNYKLDNDAIILELKMLIKEHDVSLIVFDSMVRCMEGDEDKSKEVRLIFDNLKEIFNESETSFVILHHLSKGQKGLNSLRGSGDFGGMADVVLILNKLHDGSIRADMEKNRHIDTEKLKNFNYKVVSDEEEGSFKFEFLSFNTESITKRDACMKALLEWFDVGIIQEFKTAEAQTYVKNLGFSPDTYKEARNMLLGAGSLQKATKKGYYIVTSYQKIDEEDVK